MHFVEHTRNLLQQGARSFVPKSVEMNDESRITDNEVVAVPRGQHSITSFGVRIEGRSRSDHNGAGCSSSSSSACSSSSLRQLKDCASTSKASLQGHMKQPSTPTGDIMPQHRSTNDDCCSGISVKIVPGYVNTLFV